MGQFQFLKNGVPCFAAALLYACIRNFLFRMLVVVATLKTKKQMIKKVENKETREHQTPGYIERNRNTDVY